MWPDDQNGDQEQEGDCVAIQGDFRVSSSECLVWTKNLDPKPGNDVIIVPAVTDDMAKEKYPEGWKTVKPYLRLVKQPK